MEHHARESVITHPDIHANAVFIGRAASKTGETAWMTVMSRAGCADRKLGSGVWGVGRRTWEMGHVVCGMRSKPETQNPFLWPLLFHIRSRVSGLLSSRVFLSHHGTLTP